MTRAITLNNLRDKTFKTFDFKGIWADTFGQPEKNGAWLIYGAEKNGKTWFALKLAEYLSQFDKTLYISAEEGTSKAFVDTVNRAQLEATRNLNFYEYIEIEKLTLKLKKQRSPKIVVFDNITVYNDELKGGALARLLREHKNKLFIFLAHEERNEPYTAAAKMCRKLAKIIIRVKGLACFVSGRCPGGILTIDETKAQLYHGSAITHQIN